MATYGEWEYIRLTGNKGSDGETGVGAWTPVLVNARREGDTFIAQGGVASTWNQMFKSQETYKTMKASWNYIPTGVKAFTAKIQTQNETPYQTSGVICVYHKDDSNKTTEVYIKGTKKYTDTTTRTVDDVWSVSYDGTTARAYKNGVEVYSENVAVTGSLYFDTWCWNSTDGSARVKDVTITEIGIKGTNAPNVKFQYSPDGSNWSDTPSSTTQYMRSSNDNGTTWSSAFKVKGETGLPGEDGDPGEPAKLWMFKSTSETFDRNLRNSNSQTIALTGQISGYTETPTYSSVPAGLVTQSGNDAVLTIPYNQSTYDEVTVVMKYGSSTSGMQTYYEKKFTVIDKTSYDHYLGFIENPDAYTLETTIVGDYFVADGEDDDYTRGNAYEKQQNGNWLPISSSNATLAGHISASDKLLDCLNRLKQDSSVDLRTISDANTVSWFNTLVADEGVFNKLFAKKLTMTGDGQIRSVNFDGTVGQNYDNFNHGYMLSGSDGIIRAVGAKFKNISVDDNSTFMGDINSDCFKTTNAGGDGQTRNLRLQTTGARYSEYDYVRKLVNAGITSDGIYSVSGGANYIRRGTSVLYVTTVGRNQSYTVPWESTQTMFGNIAWRIANDSDRPLYYRRSALGDTPIALPAHSSMDWGDLERGEIISNPLASYSGDIKIYSINELIGSRHTYTFIKYETGWISFNHSLDVNPEYDSYLAVAPPTITYNGTSISAPALYKWDNSVLPTTPGGGNVSSGSSLTLVTRDGSISISNKSLLSVYWPGNTTLYLTDTSGNSYVIDTNTYYLSLGGSFTVPSRQNLVESTSIIPRDDATHTGPYSLGTTTRKWSAVYANGFVGNVTGDVTGNITGNVNAAGTTNKVYGAVFN